MRYNEKDLLGHLIVLISIVAMSCLLLASESDVLHRAQALSLFLPTQHYWETLCIYPGGTLSWMGCWVMQYLYHPAIGVTLLGACWLGISLLLCHIHRLRGTWIGLSLVAPLLLLGIITQSGYWIYYQKLEGFLAVPTLGVLLALMATSIYHLLPHRWGCKLVWVTMWTLVGYPLLGAYGLLGTGLMMIPRTWQKEHWQSRIALPAALGALLLIAVPHILVQQGYSQVNPEMAYRAALPTCAYGETDLPEYRWPYYLLLLSLVVRPIPLRRKEQWAGAVLSLSLVAATLWEVNRIWYRDVNFHKEIRMNDAVEQQQWERVLTIMLEPNPIPPTRLMVMYKNLALFRLGRAGDELFHYPEGSTPQFAPWPIHLSQVGGPTIYYHYGKENYCYRWCMESSVEFGWNIENLTKMVKASLLNHDWEVARKYLNLLKKTRYYSEWAAHYETYLYHPEAIEADTEMKPIAAMMTGDNHLDSDNMLVELYIINTFASSQGENPLFQEMTLLCAMLQRDIPHFWPRFFDYCSLHRGEHIPTHYQEAAYLYGHLENQVDISHMPFDDTVRESYEAFMRFNDECGPMTTEQKKAAFRPQFGNTFYYYYFLQRNLQTN